MQSEKQYGAPLSPLETKIDAELDERAELRSGFARTARDTIPSSASAPAYAPLTDAVYANREREEADEEYARAVQADNDRLRSEERKRTPLCTGLLDYCPDALDLIAFAAEDELPPADAKDFDLEEIVINALRYRDRDGAPQWSEYRRGCLAALAILHREITGAPPAHTAVEVCDLRPGLGTLFVTHFLAFEAIAQVSWHGNNKHNPGQPLHHSREKSTDHPDCALRHLTNNATDPGGFDGPFMHAAALCWRMLMLTQIALEKSGARKARGAR